MLSAFPYFTEFVRGKEWVKNRKNFVRDVKKKSSLHYQWVVKNELFDKDLEMKTLHCKICKKKKLISIG